MESSGNWTWRFFDVLMIAKTKFNLSFLRFLLVQTNFLFTVSELFFIISSINSLSFSVSLLYM